MLTTDQTPAAFVPTLATGVRASGRRRAAGAVAAESVSSSSAPLLRAETAAVLDTQISPRRAARAAREAAAAAELSAPVATISGSFGLPGLAASVPTPASPTGRRHTFLPAPPVARHRPVGDTFARRTALARPSTASVATASTADSAAVAGSVSTTPRRGTAVVVARRGAMLAVVCGILATSILPVLSATQSKAYASGTGVAYTAPSLTGGQNYSVAADVTDTVSTRDGYGATSVVDYEQQVIDNRLAQTNTTYTGPTAADYLVHPLFAHLDRAEVFQVALQYLGTPYVHGGADPSAFDCSGLIMFVYAQFGIALPHYVPSQDAMGTTIPQSEAVPGDLVVFDNDAHDGIYAGNDMILDAPKPGGHVSVRPIWNQAHHFVRIAG